MMKKLFLLLGFLFLFNASYGQDLFGPGRSKDTAYVDPNDFNVNEVIGVDTVNGEKVFVGIDQTSSGSGVDTTYLYFRAHLSQHNSTNSGRLFIGNAIYAETDTASFYAGDSALRTYSTAAYQTNFSNQGVSNSMSAKVSTGVYYLQFRNAGSNAFASDLVGIGKWQRFESRTYIVFGKRKFKVDPVDDEIMIEDGIQYPVLMGYLVVDPGYDLDSYFGTGKLLFRTFDASWTPTDNILDRGVTVELKALKNIIN